MKKIGLLVVILLTVGTFPSGIVNAEESLESASIESTQDTSLSEPSTSETEDSSVSEVIPSSSTETEEATTSSVETDSVSPSKSNRSEETETSSTISSIYVVENIEIKLPQVKYATISEKKVFVYKDKEQIGLVSEAVSEDLQNKTFQLQSFVEIDGEKYYSLTNFDNSQQGFVSEKNLQIVDDAQGAPQPYDKYVTITSKNYTVWGSFFGDEKTTTSTIYGKTLIAKEIYQHFNGAKYLSLYDNTGAWIGYLNQNGAKLATGPQGAYQTFNNYVTITSKNYTVWGSFFGNQKTTTSTIYGKTLIAKGIYQHFNGAKYLSLYDNTGAWIGYLNQNGTKVAAGAQGTYQSFNKYVTITSKNYAVWGSFFGNQKTTTSTIYGTTLIAKGIYQHFNGAKYLSLYDNKGVWIGYLNQDGAKVAAGPQGVYQSYGKDVAIINKNYTVWGGFFSNERMITNKIYGKTLNAKGVYHHFNGAKYLSLYDKNKWVGYLNQGATSVIVNGKKILAVPIVPQLPELPTGCEITAVTMMLRYHGANVNKTALAREMPKHGSNPNYGYVGNPFTRQGWTIYPPALTTLIKKYSGSSTVLTGKGIKELENSLHDGKPVVVWVTMHGFSVHAITLTGLDKTNFYYNDPWTGNKNVAIKKNTFLNLWNQQNRRAISI